MRGTSSGNRSWPRSVLGVSILLLFCLTDNTVTAADFKDSYKKGLEAVEEEDWAAVIRWMEEAASSEPTPRERVRIRGFGRVPYIPYYYLGIAYYDRGDCGKALVHFENTLAKEEIFRRYRDDCVDRRKEEERARQVGIEERQDARVQLHRLVSEVEHVTEGAPSDVSRPTEELSRSEADLERSLDRARRTLQADGATLSDLEAARNALVGAANRFEHAVAEADRAAERASRSESDAPKRAAASSLALPNGAAADSAGVETATPEVPDSLRAAAGAYFAGEYRSALELLNGDDYDDRRATTQAYLFRSAARYALYLLDGEENDELLWSARDDATACRRLEPRLVPDEVFSPRFVSFYTEHGGGD